MRLVLPTAAGLCLLLGGCGGGTSYTPAPTPAATTDATPTRPVAASVAGPQVEVIADRRFAELRWSAGERSGRGTLVSRTWPRGREDGTYRFRFVLEGAPDGDAAVSARASLPYSVQRTTQLTLGREPATVDLREDRPCTFTACPPAASPDTPTVHVSPRGDDDAADGSETKPFGTIQRALEQDGARTVVLASGTYRGWRDETKRDTPVTVTAAAGARPVLTDAVLTGSGLRLRHLGFRGEVSLGDDDAPAQDIEISQSSFTGPGYVSCVSIAPGSERIALRENWLRDCRNAIGGGYSGDPDGPDSRRITIQGNLIERMYGDGIQMTKWRDVAIRHNVIRDLRARRYDDHNDGVQIVGGARRVQIVGNEFRRSDNQMVLIGEDFGLPTDDVLVANNVMYGAGSWAINNFGASRVRIVNNTAWGGSVGGLILGANENGRSAGDTVIVNNILDRMFLQGRVRPGRQARNLIGAGKTAGARDLVGVTPRFVDEARGDLRLRASSPARRRAIGALAPRTDQGAVLRGRRTALGAYR